MESAPPDEKAIAAIKILLRTIGDDPEREGLLETPERVLRAYREHFSGYAQDPAEHLARTSSVLRKWMPFRFTVTFEA
jgi:GTP cyclohydrolase I